MALRFLLRFPKQHQNLCSWKRPIRLFSSIILPYDNLPHHSVQINVGTTFEMGEKEFSNSLRETIASMKAMNKNAIFMNIPMAQSKYISFARSHGFTFHHAEDETAVLQLWLASCESKIPLYGTHSCGVGGIVFSGEKILIVREHPPNDKVWKYPGGYTNLGEDFGDAAVREVFEETNIQSKYHRLLAFRHSHAQQFGRSNLYVLCLLEALTTDIKLDSEIVDAKWESIHTFRNEYQTSPLVKCITDLALDALRNKGDSHIIQEKQMCYSAAGSKPFTIYF